MPDLLAVAYAMRVEDLRHDMNAALAAAATAGGDAQIPEWDQVVSDFDAALAAEPAVLAEDPHTRNLKQALGLR